MAKLVAVLALLGFILTNIGVAIYGIYLSFVAHLFAGIVVMLTPPSGLIVGWAKILGGINLAQKSMEFFQ